MAPKNIDSMYQTHQEIFENTNNNETRKIAKTYKWDIVWTNVFILSAFHIIALYGMFRKFDAKWQTDIWVKLFAVLSEFGITVGCHRLWSHRTYVANMPCQLLLATLASFTYQNSIYIWCRDHRLHHKCSETDGDPHNAKRGIFFSHMGWLLVRKHKDVIEEGKSIDMSDLQANPIIVFQHKYYYPIIIALSFGLPIFIPCYFWNETFMNSFLSRIRLFVISEHLTWTINSLAHAIGHKPFDKDIGPTESIFPKYIALGEGFHNYHHTFPWDYKASEYGFEGRNLSAGVIDFFAYIGWVTERKSPSKDMIEKRTGRTGDGSRETKPTNFFYSTGIFILFLAIL